MCGTSDLQEPDTVRKYESEERSSFGYGTFIRTDIVRNKLLFIEEDSAMGKLGKKNKDSKEAANKKIAQQLAALKRKQAAKKK